MNHFASPAFWSCYEKLPANVQNTSDKNFSLLKKNPKHPSLHLKRIGRYWSARVGVKHRALAVESDKNLVWFWIGSHADYDELIRRS